MMEDTGEDLLRAKPSPISTFFKRLGQTYQLWLDRWTPHSASRWIFTFVLVVAFVTRVILMQWYQKLLDDSTPFVRARWACLGLLMLCFLARIIFKQGWYIVTYALAIYHLNLLLAFLTPKIDPAMAQFEEEEADDGMELPTRQSDEFRPFIRRLPEFKFWYSATKATVIAFICTFFQFFNIPVFWPILVMYFITLFCITMKRQIKHMIRYRYIPFTWGKPKFQSKDDGQAPLVPPK